MKKRSYAQLKKMVDHFFSIWIRRRWENSDGLAICVTCGNSKPWQQLQCGHFISRVHLATRWDDRNAAPQCSTCNVLRRGNMAEYALWLSKRYGPHIMQELINVKNLNIKFTRTDLWGLIEEYKRRIADLDQRGVGQARGKKVGDNSLRLHGETIDTP